MTAPDLEALAHSLAVEIAFEAARLINDSYQWAHRRKECGDRLNAITAQHCAALLALAREQEARPTCGMCRHWLPFTDGPPYPAGTCNNSTGLTYTRMTLGRWHCADHQPAPAEEER